MHAAQLLFPDFGLILCGLLLCRFTPLNRSIWQPVENLVYFFLFPVLLFYSIARSPLNFQATSQFIAGGLLLGACGVALAYAIPWWPGLGSLVDRRQHAATATAVGTIAVGPGAASAPTPLCAVDRPFFFTLMHSPSGTPLLMGRVVDPSRR